ncbi:MAG: alpha/beta hydrolase [Myxococcales bacterium]|nr:alpha/beta hydrolase [Myxococcales bacterium]
MSETRVPAAAWGALAVGLIWLVGAGSRGWGSLGLALVPGLLLAIGGGSFLLLRGETRANQLVALGGVVGVPLAAILMLVSSFWLGLFLVLASAGLFAAAGWVSLRRAPAIAGVPEPVPSLALACKVAIDEAVLSTRSLVSGTVGPGDRGRLSDEARDARRYLDQRGWLDKPSGYHLDPPALEAPELRRRRTRGTAFEEISFESGYEPYAEEPGRERWLSYAANRAAYAWVLEHSDGPRPWLLCVHGFRMGSPSLDLAAFRAVELHRRLGLNLVLPVLPLHGPRKIGRRSGERFLAGDLMDTLHAEAQAIWDLRRVISWVRGRGAIGVGAFGLSLGGYTVALLAGLEKHLSCVIAGIPASDLARLGDGAGAGSAELPAGAVSDAEAVLRVVSPLAFAPRVALSRRFVFGGTADRLVPPNQVLDLWEHWERPRICWFPGSHMSYRFEAGVRELIAEALSESGLGSNPRT